MNVNLHVDRLIVEGLPLQWRERHALQAAIEQHLANLFATRGLPSGLQASSSVAQLAAPAIRVDSVSGPRSMGMQIGDSIFAGLSPAGAGPHAHAAASEHGGRNMRNEP